MNKILILVIFIRTISYGQHPCSFQTEKDKFTDKVIYKTPIECKLKICPVMFTRIIKDKDTSDYLTFYIHSRYASYGAKGLYVIFENGERWVREDMPIDVSYISSGNYSLTAYLKLTAENLYQVANYKITDLKLYSTEVKIDRDESEGFVCSLNNILKGKNGGKNSSFKKAF